jgi:hypothetical protein
LAACGGEKKEAAGNTSTPAPAKPAAAAPAAPAGGSEFGVPECDEYMNKYLACIDSKVPEAMRGTVRQQLDASKASWKQAASTPEGRAALASTCKQALEATKQAMAAYGCTW